MFKNLIAKIAGKWLARKVNLTEGALVDKKKWYQSKTIWSDVATILMAIVAFVDVNFTDGKIVTNPLYQGFLAILGAMGIKGRASADKQIG